MSTSPPTTTEEVSCGGGDSQHCGSYPTVKVHPHFSLWGGSIHWRWVGRGWVSSEGAGCRWRRRVGRWQTRSVAVEHKLVADTLYRTVSYVDHFLSANPLGRNSA